LKQCLKTGKMVGRTLRRMEELRVKDLSEGRATEKAGKMDAKTMINVR